MEVSISQRRLETMLPWPNKSSHGMETKVVIYRRRRKVGPIHEVQLSYNFSTCELRSGPAVLQIPDLPGDKTLFGSKLSSSITVTAQTHPS